MYDGMSRGEASQTSWDKGKKVKQLPSMRVLVRNHWAINSEDGFHKPGYVFVEISRKIQ